MAYAIPFAFCSMTVQDKDQEDDGNGNQQQHHDHDDGPNQNVQPCCHICDSSPQLQMQIQTQPQPQQHHKQQYKMSLLRTPCVLRCSHSAFITYSNQYKETIILMIMMMRMATIFVLFQPNDNECISK